jgi:hypothetical protein
MTSSRSTSVLPLKCSEIAADPTSNSGPCDENLGWQAHVDSAITPAMAQPAKPDAETREHLLGVLSHFIARSGDAPFLVEPVAPGEKNFPEPWAPTRAGVQLLLRRLAWHASAVPGVGVDRAVGAKNEREIVVEDKTAGAPPTERKPATRCELVEVHKDKAVFALGFVGNDDVVGTLAHEIGMIYAVTHRPDEPDPYRTAEPPVISVDHDHDPELGSIAAVYVGLGVLAANAAYQQYSRAGVFNGAYEPLEYDVLKAGALPMSSLAYLLAVQAVVRGTDEAPKALKPPQRDEVEQWIDVLEDERDELRVRLGISSADRASDEQRRVERFADAEAVVEEEPRSAKNAFRWHTHRGGVGMLLGLACGVGAAVTFGSAQGLGLMLLGGGVGHVVGRFVSVPRCSACATIVAKTSTGCRKCGARLRGDISSLSQRLEAEERLEHQAPAQTETE